MWLRKRVSSHTYQSQTSQNLDSNQGFSFLGNGRTMPVSVQWRQTHIRCSFSIRPQWQQKSLPFNTRALYSRDSITELSSVITTSTCPTWAVPWDYSGTNSTQILKPMCRLVSAFDNILPQVCPKLTIIKNTEEHSLLDMLKEDRNLHFMKKITCKI